MKVLNGGLQNWTLEGLPLEEGSNVPAPASFTAQVHPDLLATLDDVQRAILDPDVVLVDALPVANHDGSMGIAGLRGGHIPTAINVPAPDNLDPARHLLLPPDDLARLWEGAGLGSPQRAITYCGGGYYGSPTSSLCINSATTSVCTTRRGWSGERTPICRSKPIRVRSAERRKDSGTGTRREIRALDPVVNASGGSAKGWAVRRVDAIVHERG